MFKKDRQMAKSITFKNMFNQEQLRFSTWANISVLSKEMTSLVHFEEFKYTLG
jgi:hypothetical protein